MFKFLENENKSENKESIQKVNNKQENNIFTNRTTTKKQYKHNLQKLYLSIIIIFLNSTGACSGIRSITLLQRGHDKLSKLFIIS